MGRIPALRALTRPLADIEEVARRALPSLTSALGVGFRVQLKDGSSQIGGGLTNHPGMPTRLMAIEHDYKGAHRIASRFRQARPPIVGRVEGGWFVLDPRLIVDALELVPNWIDELEGPEALGP